MWGNDLNGTVFDILEKSLMNIFTTDSFLEELISEELISSNETLISVDRLKGLILQEKDKEVVSFYARHLGKDLKNTYFLASSGNFDIYKIEDEYTNIVNLRNINSSRRINKFLEAVNYKIPTGGMYISSVETYASRKKRLLRKYAFPVNYGAYLVDSFFHRILPKVKYTQKIYFYLTKGKNRMLSRAETFGRLYSCGFEVLDEWAHNDILYFVARKTERPAFDTSPTYGPLIRLRRIGKDGKIFKVFKLRTMYPYAEYLQDYIYKNNQLDEGGKFKDDFRISPLGRFLRKFWIDELPMIWNLLKGEMKLIGVRPLSRHYFSLYSPELQKMRTETKPGLVPPFYADMPKTLEEIMASERKYLELYSRNPITTDIKYFFLIFRNIFLRGARSK
ncbi:sugar transferase [Algoriphagus terrigena]|uniref:sugar transferase n=1 Tax=Algoriphagus terrigena TaxID=344884 RepID=UPI0003FEFFFC|nr:sugar transferase [Algoriphagus terrigena]